MRIQRLFITVGIVMSLVVAGWAQSPNAVSTQPATDAIQLSLDRGVVALVQSLRKLQTRASLIMVTAHPDDEDGGMLTYESRGNGVRSVLLCLNRGEGGQNVMSHDYFDALGEVRTQELLQAVRYYHASLYFTRVADYGFSKTKEEAFEKWGHDRVLYDVVRVIRMTRPLVVTSVFVGGPTDGHGHHQVAGITAQEAFDAAADPNVFPDQIKAGLLPWKPLKVYSRIPWFAMNDPKGLYDYATGRYVPVRFYDYVNKKWDEGPLSVQVEIPSFNYDPILGENYVQIARTGLGYQKTQNGGTGPAPAGGSPVGYHRWASVVPVSAKETSIFDGIDVSLMGIADLATGGDAAFLKEGLAQINSAVQDAVAKFNVQQPENVASPLARGLKATRSLIAAVNASNLSQESKYNVTHELRVKESQFNDAIVQALGVTMLATVAPEKDPGGRFAMFGGTPETFQVAIPGQTFWVKVSATNQSRVPAQVSRLTLRTPAGEKWSVEPVGQIASQLVDNQTSAQKFKVTVPKNAGFTRPYFSRSNTEQPYYDIKDDSSLDLPTSPYPLAADLDLTYDGEAVKVSQVVQVVQKLTGPGIVYEPLIVGPAISLTISPKAGVIPLGGSKFNLDVNLHSNVKGDAKGTAKLDLPSGWTSNPADLSFDLAKDGEEQHVSFVVTPSKLASTPYQITAVATYNGEKYTQGYDLTGYDGLRGYPLYETATYKTRGVDVKVAPNLKVGYVEGTGDEVAQSLEDIGIHAQFLGPQDLATGDLSKYDCIVLGVRAYAARPDLITYNGRILRYVQNGGVVFVQYNTAQYDHDFGPYPYSLTTDPEKVVDETAKVEILEPKNPLMNWPNKITSADFNGWVEERGHSFMKSWDPHYVALTEVHDPDQDPQKGGLLYARYGKGVYVYGAYALYRQLPEGVPGAYRLFANALSLAHNPAIAGSQEGKKEVSAR
jgi:LmbE family N-acetylglucosaminyl deacetylase